MVNYISVYFISILSSFFGYKFKKLRSFFLLLAMLVVSFLVGFRSIESGIDTASYYQLYDDVLEGGIAGTWMENKIGYVFYYLSLIAEFLGGDASYLTFFYALLTCGLTFYTIFKYSSSPAISFAYFFTGIGLFFYMHNVMRQALAISVVFASLHFICKKEIVKFAASMLVAYMMHASAIIFLPFYYIARFPIKPVFFLLAWVLTIPFVFIPTLVSDLILSIDFLIPEMYSVYLYSARMYEAGGLSGFGFVFLLKQIFFILFLLAYRKDFKILRSHVIYSLSMTGIVLGNISLHLGLMARFADYFLVFIMLALPLSSTVFKKNERCFFYFFLFVILIVLFFNDLVKGVHGVVV